MPTFSELDLIIPALENIAASPDGIGTSDLLSILRRQLKPTGEDLEILANRNDDKFSQKVRNLRSHGTLEKRGLATVLDGLYHITDVGEALAAEGIEVFRSLRDQGFNEEQRQSALDRNYENILIEEGELTASNKAVARRSALLRKEAIKHFADQNGSVACVGCGFRSEEAYGPDNRGMIEIHHTEPLFLRAGVGWRSAVAEALRQVVPLCPNCHRVVHRDRERCMPIDELQRLVAKCS